MSLLGAGFSGADVAGVEEAEVVVGVPEVDESVNEGPDEATFDEVSRWALI